MTMEREEWLGLFSTTIKKACQSALLSWMEKEFCMENCRPDKVLYDWIAYDVKYTYSLQLKY